MSTAIQVAGSRGSPGKVRVRAVSGKINVRTVATGIDGSINVLLNVPASLWRHRSKRTERLNASAQGLLARAQSKQHGEGQESYPQVGYCSPALTSSITISLDLLVRAQTKQDGEGQKRPMATS
jgi:hypothetical protein